MATISGRNAHVYLQGSGTTAVPITEAADFSMDVDFGLDNDNAFGDTWETKVKNLLRYSGTVQANFDTAQSVLFDSLSQYSARKMYVYPDRASTDRYYYGTVWPKLGTNIPIGLAKATFAFEGDGQLALN